MKKIIISLLSLFLLFNLSLTNAINITIVDQQTNKEDKLTRTDIFNYFGDSFNDKVTESYKYIDLNFKGINKDSELYGSLQKLVYLNLIKNTHNYIWKNKTLSAFAFYKLAENIYNVKFTNTDNIDILRSRDTVQKDLKVLSTALSDLKYKFETPNNSSVIREKKLIFSDVYKTLETSYYDSENVSEKDLINSAIEGLAKGVHDKHTVYFPPVKNKNFNESLTGKYEGIGAYVDMERPGELSIVSPIAGSPAIKAGLKGGDIVTHVDGVKIEKNNGLTEVVSWIKGPAGTNVLLTVKRGRQILNIEVTRGNIVIKDIEYEVINRDTFYMKLKFFGPNTFSDFKEALESLSKERKIKKVILDLRNNPGGYLDQVTNMLSFFVPEGEPTAVVKYKTSLVKYKSKGYDLIDFSKYKLVILQNGGSASASEIMIGTIKDYYPDVTLVGENTYGKGSVQTIKSYRDGGSLKYTIAKWFTGKTETGIDGIGIAPDIEIENNINKENNSSDEQLKKAESLR